jgi:pyrroloquinoline quinone biosynthesis protein D
MNGNSRPQLACGVRLFWDDVRQQHFLLFPEGAIALNQSARAILQLCGGTHHLGNYHRTIDEIVAELQQQFPRAKIESEVHKLIAQIAHRGLLNDANSRSNSQTI